MLVSGVRISWLMLVRKAEVRRFISSAFSLASISSISASFFRVMLRLIHSVAGCPPARMRTTRAEYHCVAPFTSASYSMFWGAPLSMASLITARHRGRSCSVR